jgi:hypothetical protein
VLNYYRWDKVPISPSAKQAGVEPKVFLPIIFRGEVLRSYKVKEGETLLEIAVRLDTTVQELMDVNHLENPLQISAGQEIMVPFRDTQAPSLRMSALRLVRTIWFQPPRSIDSKQVGKDR